MKNAKVAYSLFFFNAIYLITLLGYPVVLMLCVFMFDAPTSYDYISNYITVYIMASYPVAVLLSLSCWIFIMFVNLNGPWLSEIYCCSGLRQSYWSALPPVLFRFRS